MLVLCFDAAAQCAAAQTSNKPAAHTYGNTLGMAILTLCFTLLDVQKPLLLSPQRPPPSLPPPTHAETVNKVDMSRRPFKLWTDSKEVTAQTLIIATGAVAKRLPFKGSDEEGGYWNKGISACAVCDGAAPIFRNKPIAVIGGGDSAMEEALFLTKYGSQVRPAAGAVMGSGFAAYRGHALAMCHVCCWRSAGGGSWFWWMLQQLETTVATCCAFVATCCACVLRSLNLPC
jgi:hypothetical protein